MYNETVSRGDTGWTYDPVEEWPEGKTSFFGYAPKASPLNGVSITPATYAGAPVLTYDMSVTGGRTDVLIGTNKDKTQTTTAVDIPLRSVMAKVGVKIKGDGGQKITKVVLLGINKTSTIALDKTNDGYFTWLPGEFTRDEYAFGLNFDEGQNYVTATSTMTDIIAPDGYLYVIPQNYTFEARIVVTVDGQKLGFSFADMLQSSPGEEYFFELNLSGGPLDYTDNGKPAFLIARHDAEQSSNITNDAAKAACEASGYRLPTLNEAALILTYMYGIEDNNFRFASYWAGTYYKPDPSNAMGYNMAPSYLIYMPAGPAITCARCVKDGPAGKRYPYVDTSSADGPIIVSRDAEGGVIPEAYSKQYDHLMTVFHENWETTPPHLEMTTADAIPYKLQVANTDAGPDMIASGAPRTCPSGWRVPTHKELMFIYALGGATAASYDLTAGSQFYNPPVTDTPLHGVAGFTPFKTDHYWCATGGGISFPFVETAMRGVGKIRDDLSGTDAYLRCVKDIE
jgi:predicted nucleic acid-binding Zn ribbon protein